jgi:ABC-type sugar transport system ATPase subunit
MNVIAPEDLPRPGRLVAATAGQAPTVGIRAHDITLSSADDPEADARGRIETVEPLGSTTIVHVALDVRPGVSIRVVAPADSHAVPDDVVGVRFRRDRLHFFDRQTGCRVETSA